MSEQAQAPDRTLVPLTGLRGIISRSMTQAWQAPRVALGLDVPMDALLARAKAISAERGVKVTPTALMLQALALTLKEHPRLNALLTDKGIEEIHAVNLAVAVHTDKGLVTPVIRDAGTKDAVQLAEELGQMATAARTGKLAPAAYQKGTFTLSNLATAGIDWVTPILNPPQVGILGVGQTREAVVVRDGVPAVAKVATLNLVFDHRAVDGYPASLFLRDLGARLQAAEL
ncbi:2-oxo acid dehydrogenase subunit E2 [Pseudomonas sp. SA3-5]|uniref:2-oxo acid dehydrogenase subunit E2 n=1 Tax=Pseudomonas aestuarii TaxID=3018340 RepID=A0ABT4XKD8_9PSED|nr:2-oxo acid dehydrogenase subunit E2 [Pseudomonas aestuarii]MDA7088617.1 2-oxo acid dehydrogenase subunit E2 [Pseudomonas aestuarii]